MDPIASPGTRRSPSPDNAPSRGTPDPPAPPPPEPPPVSAMPAAAPLASPDEWPSSLQLRHARMGFLGTIAARCQNAVRAHRRRPEWESLARALATDDTEARDTAVYTLSHALRSLDGLAAEGETLTGTGPVAAWEQAVAYLRETAAGLEPLFEKRAPTGPAALAAGHRLLERVGRSDLFASLHADGFARLSADLCWSDLGSNLRAPKAPGGHLVRTLLACQRATLQAEATLKASGWDTGVTPCFVLDEVAARVSAMLDLTEDDEPPPHLFVCAWEVFALLHRADAITALAEARVAEAHAVSVELESEMVRLAWRAGHGDDTETLAAIAVLGEQVVNAREQRLSAAWPSPEAWAEGLGRLADRFLTPDTACSDLLERVQPLADGRRAHGGAVEALLWQRARRAQSDLRAASLMWLGEDGLPTAAERRSSLGALLRLTARAGCVGLLREIVVGTRGRPDDVSEETWAAWVSEALEEPAGGGAADGGGDTPLHAALEAPADIRAAILGVLLSRAAPGMTVNVAGGNGDAPLHRATKCDDGAPEAVALLLAHGADPSALDFDRERPRARLVVQGRQGWGVTVRSRFANGESGASVQVAAPETLAAAPLRRPACEASWQLLSEARLHRGLPALTNLFHRAVPETRRLALRAAAVGLRAALTTLVLPRPNHRQDALEHGGALPISWQDAQDARASAMESTTWGTDAWCRAVAVSTQWTRQGDCFAHTAAAYAAIRAHDVFGALPVEVVMMGDHGRRHRCLIINRDPSHPRETRKQRTDIAGGGPDAVICDPWSSAIYPASEWHRRAGGCWPGDVVWVARLQAREKRPKDPEAGGIAGGEI